MALVYFDASALVKLVNAESGSDLAMLLWKGADIRASSRIAAVEVASAFAAAHRNGRLAMLEPALDAWRSMARRLRFLKLDSGVSAAAALAAERYALRALDAIHLASALALLPGRVVVATWDTRLRAAVTETGLGLAPARI